MPREWARAAARNNAEWCHSFCRTHGVEGRWQPGLWSSPVRTPAYYPDAVTLQPDVGAERVLAGIDAGEGCSVKDSHAVLDLEPAGFRQLFRGAWVVREQPHDPPPAPGGWSVVDTRAELCEWEAGWGGAPGRPGLFQPALLEDRAVAVLVAREGDGVVAGAIANRSADVIGLGNVFASAGGLESAWAAGAAAAAALWPGLPVVGYDAGEGLAAALGAGFEPVGELVVWVKGQELSPAAPAVPGPG